MLAFCKNTQEKEVLNVSPLSVEGIYNNNNYDPTIVIKTYKITFKHNITSP